MASTPNPQNLLMEIEQTRDSLRELVEEYGDLRRTLASLQLNYEKAVAKVYIKMLHPTSRAQMGLEKLPAEDMRKAIAHSQMEETAWSGYLMGEADVEALDKKIKVELANLTAMQSELNQLRAEFSHA